VGWDRHQRGSRTGSAPGNVGVSSRRCRDLTTRGVRADRVGIKLSLPGARKGGREQRRRRRKLPRSWPVKPRRVAVHAVGWGLGLVRQRFSAGRKACSEPARQRRPCQVRERDRRTRLGRMGLHPRRQRLDRRSDPPAAREQRRRVERATRASARWQRSSHRRRGSGDRAVVLAGCVGCRSRRAAPGPRPKGPGSSSLAHARSRVRAQRVKRRRKPGRGGESHEHASSDTGGGLLVIPRAVRASAVRDRGREHSAMEGVLVRRSPPSLTRRRGRRAW